MKPLNGKNVLIGVSGGIAAYKSVELIRRLVDAGASVRVVMTQAATEFVSPLTFEAVSGHPVKLEMFGPRSDSATVHVELARWPDLVLIAPATANMMAKIAHGIADDLLSTTALARLECPLALAPAMNLAMWSNPATQHNCQILNQRGIMLWGPGTGYQACGEVGAGRMLEAADLAERAKAFLLGAGHILEGKRVVLTAGPTREAIDPVRYITNRSSGRMGYAVAAACARQGAKVTLVSGPVNLPTPSGVDRIEVETALQMHHEVMQLVPECDIFIATAAVADFRVALASEQKMKKSGQAGEVSITLVHNPDILAEVAAMAPAPFTVGFAAETENVAQYAKTKLVAKKLDMIAANQVGGELGFDSVENALQVYWPDGEKALPRASKEQLALQLVEMIKERYDAKTQTQNS